jgi:uncharacterized OsmC-like protein/alpha-beta hydrolase superfamily lysophospholipase
MAVSRKLEFPGSQGSPLAARLDLPDTEPRAYALFAHCFTCSKDVVAASRVARALTAAGIAVLRFDFTGLGRSGGDFANTDFSSNISDLVHAADHLRECYAAPSILIGHSLGGAAVLAATHLVPEVRAVATIAAPADPQHVVGLFDEHRDTITEHGNAEVTLAGRTFRIRRELLTDLAAQPQAARIAALGAALLVLHSPTDELVGVDNARRIFDTARHPKSFVALDGADHLLTNADDAAFVAAVLAPWAARYLPARSGAGPGGGSTQKDGHPEGQVVVSGTQPGSLAQRVTVGAHHLLADEPVPIGDDTGPTPYDLLLAGLGACTTMTLRMYAQRKRWPLDDVTVSLRHSRIHAEDCADRDTRVGRIDRIERVVQLHGDLDDDQRKRLLEIADRCPVHRTLHSEVLIDTTESR